MSHACEGSVEYPQMGSLSVEDRKFNNTKIVDNNLEVEGIIQNITVPSYHTKTLKNILQYTKTIYSKC